MNKREIC